MENGKHIRPLSELIRVGYRWGVRTAPLSGLVFSIWLAVKIISTSGVFSPTLLLVGPFFLMSMLNTVGSFRSLEMDSKTVHVSDWLGRREMKWEEIEYIECGHSRDTTTMLVFYGCDKQLKMTGPSNWWDTDYRQILEFLEAQAEQHQIKILRRAAREVIL